MEEGNAGTRPSDAKGKSSRLCSRFAFACLLDAPGGFVYPWIIIATLMLINANRMTPPIAPIGLDYVAAAARTAGLDTEVLDLCLGDGAEARMVESLQRQSWELIGISFRNVDDCF